MGNSRSSHPITEPIHAAYALLLTLFGDRTTPNMPLDAIPHGSKWIWIRITEVTTILHLATCAIFPALGFINEDIISRSMCAGDVIAPLISGFEYDKTNILGWRRS